MIVSVGRAVVGVVVAVAVAGADTCYYSATALLPLCCSAAAPRQRRTDFIAGLISRHSYNCPSPSVKHSCDLDWQIASPQREIRFYIGGDPAGRKAIGERFQQERRTLQLRSPHDGYNRREHAHAL